MDFNVERLTCWRGRCGSGSPQSRAWSIRGNGDQPALNRRDGGLGALPPDFARRCRQGTKSLPGPITDVTLGGVWGHYGRSADEAQSAGLEPADVQSFLDGTKSAIEMAAIRQLTPASTCRPAGAVLPAEFDDRPHVMRPRDGRGDAGESGVVLEGCRRWERDGRPVFRDLRWGGLCRVPGGAERLLPRIAQAIRDEADASGRIAGKLHAPTI